MSRRVFFRDNEAQGFSTYGLLLDTLFRQLKTVGVAGYFPYEYQEDMRCGYAELVSFFGEEFGRLAEQEGDTSNLSILSKHVSLRGMLLEKYRKDNERYLAARNSLSIKSLKKAEEVNEPSWDKLYASAEAEDARGEEGIKDSYEGKPDSAVVNSFLAAINGAHAVDDSSAPAYVEDDEEPVGGYFSDEDEEYSSELPDDDDAEYSSELPDDDDEEYSSELPDDDEYPSELSEDDDEYSSELPDDDEYDEDSSELPEDEEEGYSSELPEDDEDGEDNLSEFPDDDDEGYSSELPEDDEGDPSELPEDDDEDSSELPEDDDDEDSSELPADDDDEYDDEDSSELPADDDDEYDDEDSSELPEDDDDEYDEEDSSELPDDEDSSELPAGYSSNLPAGRVVSKPRVYAAPVVSNMVVRPSYARGIPGRETQEAVLDMMDRLANNIKGWFSRL